MSKKPSKKQPDRPNAVRVFRDSNEQILRVLEKLAEEAAQYSGAKRKSKRHKFQELECVVDIFHAGGVAPTTCVVPTRDLSASGISFLHRSYIHTGSQLTVSLRDREGKSHTIAGVIVRCRYVSGMIHEIGAKFNKPIAVHDFCDVGPLRLAMFFEDTAAAQVASHQFMCLGAEGVLAESAQALAEMVAQCEYDGVVFQGEAVDEGVIGKIRAAGYTRPIVGVALDRNTESLKDRADHVFQGPMTADLVGQVVRQIRAA